MGKLRTDDAVIVTLVDSVESIEILDYVCEFKGRTIAAYCGFTRFEHGAKLRM